MEPVTTIAEPGARRIPLIPLAILGLSAAGVYLFGLALRYPVQAGIGVPRHSWAQLAAEPVIAALTLHLAAYTAVTLLYSLALRLVVKHAPRMTAQGHRRVLQVIISGWLLASLALLAVAPGGETHDVFDYIFRGRMLAEYGASPLAVTPESFQNRPFYRYITWTDHVDTYGPLWEYASGAVAATTRAVLQGAGKWNTIPVQCPESAASCFMLLSYVLAYRILAVALVALCGWLIYILAERSPAALLAWLWNPLLLVSSAVGAHNDMLMLALMLVSFWGLRRRLWLAALLLLLLAAHVKLTVLTLAPLYGLWLVRQVGWRRTLMYAALAALIGLAISWLLYAPLGGWATLPRMLEERQRYVALSFHHLLYRLLYESGADADFARLLTIQAPSFVYFIGSVVICGFMVGWRQADPAQPQTSDMHVFWRAATVTNLFYLLIGSFWFQPWYVLWVLAPASLLPASRFTRFVLPWLCAGALWSNVIGSYLPHLPGPRIERTGRVAAAVITTWGPAAVAALLITLLRRRGQAPQKS